MSAIATTERGPNIEAIEQALVQGNLAGLNPQQRVAYYNRVCDSLGLNPLTKPFEYVTLNGKLQLYARKDCTDQLRKRDGISIRITARELVEGVYVVTASASDASGRTDEAIGAVPLNNLQGEARANAMMKAETKAKRRVSLSFCGLGFTDESEVESIPAARVVTVEEAHTEPKPQRNIDAELMACGTLADLGKLWTSLGTADKAKHIAAKDKRKAELSEKPQPSSGYIPGVDDPALDPALHTIPH